MAGGSRGIGYIYGGRVVSGVGIGGISAVAPAHVSECSPKDVRGRITGLFQIMVAMGVMISYFVNREPLCAVVSSPSLIGNASSRRWIAHGQQSRGVANPVWSPAHSCWDDVSGTAHRQGKWPFILNPAVSHRPQESPRWLASEGRTGVAITNLAYLRRERHDSPSVGHEMAEIEAPINGEREARQGLGIREAFVGKGHFVRFVIAFVIFPLATMERAEFGRVLHTPNIRFGERLPPTGCFA